MRLGLGLALALLSAAAAAEDPSPTVALKILAINDFHGNLKPPAGGFRSVPAGGAEYLATAVKTLAAQARHHVFVAAGDLIGASPLLSALFHDEPTIESLGLMGLEFAAVGNHEFDHGMAELLRLQRGGCHEDGGCRGPAPFAGAKFQYLSASTGVQGSGKPVLPPYAIKRFDGIPVAFIGLTLEGTPSIVMPSGVAGLVFRDEAETVNALVPELRRQGVEAIVVLIHEGGEPTGGYDECPGISGPIVDIAKKLDKAVDLVVSGHTHQAYNCRIDGRLVTSAHRYGTLLTEIDVQLDRKTGDVVQAEAHNRIVRHDLYAKDEAQTALISRYETLAAPLARRVVGKLAQPYTAAFNEAGESTLGRLVADAQLAATRPAERGGAQIAITNPGGLRAPLVPREGGQVLFEDVFSSQPFSNTLVTLTLSGAQLLSLLEQQFDDEEGDAPRLLQVSRGLRYTWDGRRPRGQRVLLGSLRLNGQPIVPQQRLRVTVNSFLASGGDGAGILARAGERLVGEPDAEALARYIAAGAAPIDDERIARQR